MSNIWKCLYVVCNKPNGRLLPTHRTTKTQNKRSQTSVPRVGFETMILATERMKTVHALNRTATVIGKECNDKKNFLGLVRERTIPTDRIERVEYFP
jgi:hypothetical protein